MATHLDSEAQGADFRQLLNGAKIFAMMSGVWLFYGLYSLVRFPIAGNLVIAIVAVMIALGLISISEKSLPQATMPAVEDKA